MRFVAGLIVLGLLAPRWGLADTLAGVDERGPTVSDLGGLGLLQVPTARIGQDADVHGFASFAPPYDRFGVSATVLPWAEAVFRITRIENVPYGPASFSGDQAYLDRGIDARFRLAKESDTLPDITLGLRDVAGTGLFDAEYLVATRRFDDVDVTIGLGWGQLASNHMFGNPFSSLGSHFRSRAPSGSAGSLRTDYFTGPSMSLFGGIEYRTPFDELTLQLEYDSDDYRQDPFDERKTIRANVPVDVGIVYRPAPWAALSAGFERGNTAMLKVDLFGNVARPSSPPFRPVDASPRLTETDPTLPDHGSVPAEASETERLADFAAQRGWRIVHLDSGPSSRHVTLVDVDAKSGDEDIGQIARAAAHVAPSVATVALTIRQDGAEWGLRLDSHALEIAVAETGRTAELVRAARDRAERRPLAAVGPSQADLSATIFAMLDQIGFTGESFEIDGRRAVLRFSQDQYRDTSRAIGEAARILLRYLPSDVTEIGFGVVEEGVEIARVSLLRHELADALAGRSSAEELLHHAAFSGGTKIDRPSSDAYPAFDYALRPGLKTQFGGPDGFLLYDFYAGLTGEARLHPGVTVTAELGASLASDFDRLTLPSDSVLPHVRSDIAQYLRDGKYGVSRLEFDHAGRVSDDIFFRVSAGLLEPMFGGVDGEVLYRPYGELWAAGIDVAYVRQRGFHERFAFQSYEIATGQLEFYYRLPWYGLVASVKAGRYLAGDRGGTIDISREFDSGVKIGAFATITDVPAKTFGEGSFDKGFYVSIPLDLILPFSSRSGFGYTYRPVTRDGGQMLDIAKPLYAVTGGDDQDAVERHWSQMLD